VVVASAAVGLIVGVVIGGAGYALLFAPENPQQPGPVAAQPGTPGETPSVGGQPSASTGAPSALEQPSDPNESPPAAPERPPNRLLKRDEIVTWSEKVDKELKILDVSQPGALRLLESKPQAVHVVQINEMCRAAKFNSEESQLLKDWVAAGGIVWVTNDVLSVFDIGFERSAGHRECTPSLTPELCPILTGVERVTIDASQMSFGNGNLAHENVVPLVRGPVEMLSGPYDDKCIWALVPYGKGWISDVKPVDESKFDGARCWLNFRMFCLGWDIPGANMTNQQFRDQHARPGPPAGAGANTADPSAKSTARG
jgi:hypothetical protein